MTGMTRYAVTGYTDNTTTGMSLPVRVVGQMDTPIAAEVSVEKTVAYKYDVFNNLIEKTLDGPTTGLVVSKYVTQGGHLVVTHKSGYAKDTGRRLSLPRRGHEIVATGGVRSDDSRAKRNPW